MTQNYLGVVKPEELQALRRAYRGGRSHPLVNLAFSREQASTLQLTAVNTEMAARLVSEKDADWIKALRPRLIATDDFTHAASALGEIRAYGALLETWMTVSANPTVPGSQVSPEFKIANGDGEVIVEVHSRQLDEEQVKTLEESSRALQARHAEEIEKAGGGGHEGNVVTFGETEVFPTGQPDSKKAGDSVLTNTIQRIAGIKGNEKQIDVSKPFILWLDLQDPSVWGVPVAEQLFAPLFTESRDGYIGSGPFWFALYGRKGDPLTESRGFDYRSIPLAHEGRFFQTMKSHGQPTRISAVVYSIPSASILMENPNAAHPLPRRVRAALLKLPRFRIDLSIMEWEPGLVSRIVEIQRQTVIAAGNALRGFDAAGQAG
jgi:hypothetical protein